jgi:hypothetical protein
MEKILVSIDTKHKISLRSDVIENISWFEINQIDYENFKTFLFLLKDMLEFLQKNNIKYIKTLLSVEDSKSFKNSQIIEYDNFNVAIIPIDKFLDDIVCAFGINRI